MLKLQKFLGDTFTEIDMPFCTKHVYCLMREQGVDGKPILKAFEVREGILKDQVFTLINKKPSTRIEPAFC